MRHQRGRRFAAIALVAVLASVMPRTVADTIAPSVRAQQSESPVTQPADAPPPVGGTWARLTNTPPTAVDNCLLMTDGTVLCHQYGGSRWYRLTPTNTGNYLNGTWTIDSTMQNGYAPLYFASAVLPDGRVIVQGGEYNCVAGCDDVWMSQGSFYDPATRTWTAVSGPPGWNTVGDGQAVVLANGTFMLANCCSGASAYFNPGSLSWSAVSGVQIDGYNNEEGFNLLPDGRVLTVDAWPTNSTQAEIFDPNTGLWSSAGHTPVQLTAVSSHEQGPGVLRADGTVVYFGANASGAGHTAIYNSNTGLWSAGPDFPNGDGVADGPATWLPNGNVLVQASPGVFSTPSRWYEFDKTTNTFTQVAPPAYGFTPSSYLGQMLILPSGQILQTELSSDVRLYTPVGTYDPSWAPTITSVPAYVAPGSTATVYGTQFNGLTQGASYGDDWQSATNYPLVRITNNATGHVTYAKTHDHSTMGVATGGTIVSTSFDVPAGIETGPSTIAVVVNGIPSAAVAISVGTPPTAFNKTSPVSSTSGLGASVTLSWAASSGATSYTYCVSTVSGTCATLLWPSAGNATSVTVTGLTPGATYYWQARALNGSGTTPANGGAWWTFTTAASVPGAFAKSSPATSSPGLGTSVTLSWGASTQAASYTYCVSTVSGSCATLMWPSAGTATTATVSGLTPGTTYYWQARALNGLGTTPANGGVWWAFTTAAGPPAAFNKTAPSVSAQNQSTNVTLSWAASTGATSYTYCVTLVSGTCSTVMWPSAGSATTASVSGLSPGTTYYWQARALNGAGTTPANGGAWSSFSTGPAAFNKTSPSNAAPGLGTSVTLVWAASAGATSYTYCVSTVSGSCATPTWTSSGASTAVTVTGLSPGVTYYWQARALSGASTTPANGGAWASFTTASSAPAAFGKTSPASGATGQGSSVTLNWAASVGATSYTYCVSTAAGSCATLMWPSAGSSTTATVTGLASGTTYYWQARALNGAGTTPANGGAWWSFTTQ